jgi:hypothetical protein
MPSSIKRTFEKNSSCCLFLILRTEWTVHTVIYMAWQMTWLLPLFHKGYRTYLSCVSWNRCKFHHLQVHVSFLLSHMSEHAFSQFGLVGARVRLRQCGTKHCTYKKGARLGTENISADSIRVQYWSDVPTEYTECWPCPLFDILLNKYFPAG